MPRENLKCEHLLCCRGPGGTMAAVGVTALPSSWQRKAVLSWALKYCTNLVQPILQAHTGCNPMLPTDGSLAGDHNERWPFSAHIQAPNHPTSERPPPCQSHAWVDFHAPAASLKLCMAFSPAQSRGWWFMVCPLPPEVSVTSTSALSLFPAGSLPGLECSYWGGPFPYFMERYEKAKQEKWVGLVKGREGCAILARRG